MVICIVYTYIYIYIIPVDVIHLSWSKCFFEPALCQELARSSALPNLCLQEAYNQVKEERRETVLCAPTETSTEVCGSTRNGCFCSRLLCLSRCDLELSQYKTDATRGPVWLDYQLLAQLWYHSQVRKCSLGYHSQIRGMYRIRLEVKANWFHFWIFYVLGLCGIYRWRSLVKYNG